MPDSPRFIYFDMGNVLLNFSHERAATQMADVSGADRDTVWRVVFEEGLEDRYETGKISSRQFWEIFCAQTGTHPAEQTLLKASSDIFEVNVTMKAVLGSLCAVGHRVGLLSNVCESHWNHVSDGRYGMIPDAFAELILSYQVGAMKPDEKIFHAAIEKAGVAANEILYIDDIAGHVAGASRCGIDAVQYTTTKQFVIDLRDRGVAFNY